MYKVDLYHFCPSYRNGDLEEETKLIISELFKTKKAARAWILTQVGHFNYHEDWKTGDKTSKVWYYTHKKWVNENNGESRRECFSYLINKINGN